MIGSRIPQCRKVSLCLVMFLLSLGHVYSNTKGLWRLDGNADDASGNGNNGIVTGTMNSDYGVGGCLAFDGQDDKIQFGTGPSLQGKTDFTLSAWIHTSAKKGQVIIQQRDGDYNGEYKLQVNSNGTVGFMVYGNYAWQYGFSSTSKVNDGKWHHVCAVREGTAGRIFIDGVLDGSASGTTRDLKSSITVTIGADIRDSNKYFSGLIDSVSIHTAALNEDGIRQLRETHLAAALKTPPKPVLGGISPVGISFSWSIPSYELLPASWTVMRDGEVLKEGVTELDFFDATAKAGTTHSYALKAVAGSTSSDAGEALEVAFPALSGSILREAWRNRPGSKLTDMDYSGTPDVIEHIQSFDAPQNWANSYGSRLTAFVTIPVTGTYRFYTASDDQSELKLSLTGSMSDLLPIAKVTGWTGHLQWSKSSSQKSGEYELTTGDRVLLRVRQKETGGPDHLACGWSRDNSAVEVIPIEYCEAPDPAIAPVAPTGLEAWHVGDNVAHLRWGAAASFYVKEYNLYRDGALVGTFNNAAGECWGLTASTTYGFSVATVDYQGRVSEPSQVLEVTTPAAPVIGNGTGLTGCYYAGMNFESRILVRTDSTVDFIWGSGRPSSDLPNNEFSARWTGTVLPQYDGEWTFYTQSDDGVRLWINNLLIIDNWTPHGSTENAGVVQLEAGKEYPVRLEFYERTGSSLIQLKWSHLSRAKETIPTSQLSPDPYATGDAIGLGATVESLTSPAWVEFSAGADIDSITYVKNGSQQLPARKFNDSRWYLDDNDDSLGILLNPGENSLALTATDTSGTAKVVQAVVVWKPTILNDMSVEENSVVIRKGDSLLLQANGEANLGVEFDFDGQLSGANSEMGTPVPFRFDIPGIYTVKAIAQGSELGSIKVKVVGVDLQGPIACQKGFKRVKDVVEQGTDGELVFDTADAGLMSIFTSQNKQRVELKPLAAGRSPLLVRIASTGAVIAMCEVDEFELVTPTKVVNAIEDFGSSWLIEARMDMVPYVPDLEFRLNIFVAGVTFEDSTLNTTFHSSDFTQLDEYAKYLYRMIYQKGLKVGACHRIRVYQNNVLIGN